MPVRGQLPTDFVDKSGTCSGTPGTFTTAIAANNIRSFARIGNNNASAKLYIYDKTLGTPTTSNAFVLTAGQVFIWDVKCPRAAIQIASDTASATYEAAEG